ncbi:MAG: GNAT family N-acetyltransferase [Myxococcota bacterium]|nr:GNAT family N-acetyltransferase [Myxococcota bacterium]
MLQLPIETDRLKLRRHQPDDRDAFVKLVCDKRFFAHLSVPEWQRTPDGAREVFDTIVQSYETEEPVWGLTVADRASDAFLGTVALHPIPFGEALEVFYAIVPRRWGEGLATEALSALLLAVPDKAFVALTSPANEGSKRVALRAGMTDDGIHQPLGGPERHRFVRGPIGT